MLKERKEYTTAAVERWDTPSQKESLYKLLQMETERCVLKHRLSMKSSGHSYTLWADICCQAKIILQNI